MKNVIFALSRAIHEHLSPSVPALTIASVALGKFSGESNHLMLDIVDRTLMTPPGGRDPQSFQKHVHEMLNRGDAVSPVGTFQGVCLFP